MHGSGTGSLSQGGVEVKAEMGEGRRKQRGDAMNSHIESRQLQVSSVLVLLWRKGSVSGRTPLAQHGRVCTIHYGCKHFDQLLLVVLAVTT